MLRKLIYHHQEMMQNMSINPELFYKKPDTQPNLAEKIREEKQSTLARRIGAGAAIGAGAYGTALGVKDM